MDIENQTNTQTKIRELQDRPGLSTDTLPSFQKNIGEKLLTEELVYWCWQLIKEKKDLEKKADLYQRQSLRTCTCFWPSQVTRKPW